MWECKADLFIHFVQVITGVYIPPKDDHKTDMQLEWQATVSTGAETED